MVSHEQLSAFCILANRAIIDRNAPFSESSDGRLGRIDGSLSFRALIAKLR
jgi:hypothetical protein